MHIKEIELVNFKSFGKRVKIPFYDDFTTISGPNGSGKSNIVDALLFALGLSNSRIMRAERLTDLIFNGDGDKKPDYAQVTVRFDNTDREMAVPENEVTVTRKVKQTESGYYSYYYFNEKPVSLAEMHAQLAKAKITPEGYNVVMQGDVTRIIEMSPVERRRIIDEIAGVAEFEEKTERAMNELEVVRERVERADVIIAEVDAQLNKLRNERDHAIKYQALRDEKKKFEGYVILARQRDAVTELANVGREIDEKNSLIESQKASLLEKEADKSGTEAELASVNDLIKRKGEEEQIQVRKDIESIRGEASRCTGSIEVLEREIADIEAQRRKSFVDIEGLQGKMASFDSRISEENLRKETLQKEMESRNAELRIMLSKIADVDARFAETRNRLDARRDELEKAKSEKAELMRESDRLLDAARRKTSEAVDIEYEIEDARSRIDSASVDRKMAEDEIAAFLGKIAAAQKDMDDLESGRVRLKAEQAELEAALHALQQEYARADARVRAAKEMSYSGAVEAVLQAKKTRELAGIYGTIAELGKVSERYAVALEVAAGGRMQSIVVDTDEDAARAIEYLKEIKGGRATFLPLNRMERKERLPGAPKAAGVIDYAINLITYDEKFDPAFWYVFRDTLVVDRLENARRLLGRARIVTIDGELLERSGAMTGGNLKSKVSFAASEKETLLKLSEKLTEYDSKRGAILKKLDTVEGHIAALRRGNSESEAQIVKARARLEEIASRGERLSEVIKSKQEALAESEKARAAIKAEMSTIEERMAASEAVIKDRQSDIDALTAQLEGSEVPALNAAADKIKGELERLGGRVRDVEAELNAIQLDKQYTDTRIKEMRERLAELDSRKEENRKRIDESKAEAAALEAKLGERIQREKQLDEELASLRADRDRISRLCDEKKDAVEKARAGLASEERLLLALAATKDALESQVTSLTAEVEKYGIAPEDELPPTETIRTRIESIQAAMEKLEPVNMRAIDEYNEVENRLTDMKSKRDTLFKERQGILDRIAHYEQQKKDTFMESFNGINQQFKSVFAELSDGSGELELTNAEDPFAGGMTIKAYPRDKPITRLEAMSGGEKTLTALALLFAIQQYKPAPFYAFDEIDMFLDGVNVERVAGKLKRSAGNAQFIVVSLRKPMIEAAERTIGVAMQDNNISSITGVRLN